MRNKRVLTGKVNVFTENLTLFSNTLTLPPMMFSGISYIADVQVILKSVFLAFVGTCSLD